MPSSANRPFLSRALRLHPDKGGDPELFKEVTHALVAFNYYPQSVHSDSSIAMKFSLIRKRGLYTMLEERLVCPSKAGWVELILKCVSKYLLFFSLLPNINPSRISSANCSEVAAVSSAAAEAAVPRDLVGRRIWFIGYTSPSRICIKERRPSWH
jgi:hypothetical protein